MPRLDRKGVHAALWMQDKQEKFYGGLDFAMSHSDQVRFLRAFHHTCCSCALSCNNISAKTQHFHSHHHMKQALKQFKTARELAFARERDAMTKLRAENRIRAQTSNKQRRESKVKICLCTHFALISKGRYSTKTRYTSANNHIQQRQSVTPPCIYKLARQCLGLASTSHQQSKIESSSHRQAVTPNPTLLEPRASGFGPTRTRARHYCR